MRASSRIIVNTLAQYGRTIFNSLLSLYSTRLVLDVLGIEDYGLFALVAGVVSILSFVTSALVSSTQRFLSVSQGKGNIYRLKNIFNNSLFLHIGVSVLVMLVLEALAPLWFNGFLNIAEDRIWAAKVVYQQVIVMLVISFIASPYRALLVSHENILYTSIIDMLDGVLKVVFVLILAVLPFDKLVMYGWAMLLIRFANLLAFAIYDFLNYEECVSLSIKSFDKNYVRELSSFTGWTILGTSFTVLRNQGITIIINKTMGTVVNAAYGVGYQIAGLIGFVSASLNAAIDPQLMKAEGGNDRNTMMYLARFQSKFSYFLLSMFAIPCMFEAQTILSIWLKEVPEYSSLFAIMFLGSQMVDQLTMGLSAANKAIGDIKIFTLVLGIPKFIEMPLFWATIYMGLPLHYSVSLYILMEFLTMFLRMPLLKKSTGLNVKKYISYVFYKTSIPTIVCFAVCILLTMVFDFRGRFIVTFGASICIYAIVIYFWGLEKNEKALLNNIIMELVKKIHK